MKMQSLYDQFASRIKVKQGSCLRALNAPKPPAEVGQIAPDFEGPGPKGQLKVS